MSGFLQICLVWLLLVSIWQMLGPQPQSAVEHHLQVVLAGLGRFLVITLWIASSVLSTKAKAISIGVALAAVLVTAVISERELLANHRVLEAGRVKNGRVVHEELGLSYAVPKNWSLELKPALIRSDNPRKKVGAATPLHLVLGDTVMIARISRPPSGGKEVGFPSWIMIEVQQNPYYDAAHFKRFVRSTEDKWKASKDVQIIRHTHFSKINGIDTLEYEFVKGPNHITARPVWARAGRFVINFMLLTDRDEDRVLFDEFLKSIRLEARIWPLHT